MIDEPHQHRAYLDIIADRVKVGDRSTIITCGLKLFDEIEHHRKVHLQACKLSGGLHGTSGVPFFPLFEVEVDRSHIPCELARGLLKNHKEALLVTLTHSIGKGCGKYWSSRPCLPGNKDRASAVITFTPKHCIESWNTGSDTLFCYRMRERHRR